MRPTTIAIESATHDETETTSRTSPIWRTTAFTFSSSSPSDDRTSLERGIRDDGRRRDPGREAGGFRELRAYGDPHSRIADLAHNERGCG
jgi:hypothetical protein